MNKTFAQQNAENWTRYANMIAEGINSDGTRFIGVREWVEKVYEDVDFSKWYPKHE